MDKYEYKIKAEEINELIKKGDFTQAAEIADTIDWRRVKSVSMLCTISDVYKMNRRFEEAKDLLEMAYDRHPGSRTICYSLCELTIKTEDYVQAFEYYKQFIQIAPKDPGKYVLKYKIYTAQDVSIEERIEVLKELKAHNEYHEKWLYELAYLYHRLGLVSQCVDECDELITMFGSGKYVIKAMELKRLHQPLSTEQQKKYIEFAAELAKEDSSGQVFVEPNFDDTKIYERGSLKKTDETDSKGENLDETKVLTDVQRVLAADGEDSGEGKTHTFDESREGEEPEISVKVMDPGYNTINLQETVAAGIREYLEDDDLKQPLSSQEIGGLDGDTESLDFPEISEVSEDDLEADTESAELEKTEVFFGDTSEIPESEVAKTIENLEAKESTAKSVDKVQQEIPDLTANTVMEQLRLENMSEAARKAMEAQPPKEIASVLSQDYDGQIRFVVPEAQSIERQITGQLNLDDILLEWERLKRENAEKNEQAVIRHVKEQTGEMFTEFEASLRDSLLEKLEKGEDVESGIPSEKVEEAGKDAVLTDGEPDPVDEDDEVEELIEIEEFHVNMDPEAIKPEQAKPEQSKMESEREIKPEQSKMESGQELKPEQSEAESGQEIEEVVQEKPALRSLTQEEKALFNDYIQSRAAKEQLINIIDNTTMAAYTGNIVITGDEGTETMTLCKNIIKEIKAADSNLSGKVAKISGKSLNEKKLPELMEQVANGALIIEKASDISDEKADAFYQVLQNESRGVVVVLEDNHKAMSKFLEKNKNLATCFTNRMDVQALNNDTLVAYGRQYAYNMEYSIDELGILAFHTRIEERQTLDHAVTVGEVKEIVDKAIRHANKKTLGHFFDILLAKRYDEEDMIVLGEKDFS